jgi:subtilisin-like proprotein convertase family protein
MNMKKTIISGVLALMMAGSVRASLYIETFTVNGGTIPDGNPIPTRFSGSVSDAPAGTIITGVTVGLNILGGYNGDLYAYLVSPNGTVVVLLNQPGVVNPNTDFGFSDPGFNVTLSDGSYQNINNYGNSSYTVNGSGQVTGTYNAVGTLANFDGGVADGTWNLYFADLASGSPTSTLESWSLNIDPVPEPVNAALGIFLALAGAVMLAREAMRRFLKNRNSTRQ